MDVIGGCESARTSLARTATSIAEGYSHSGEAWSIGPARIYNHLAEVLLNGVAIVPGGRALDLGAGTGAASTAMIRKGVDVVAVDAAAGMLRVDQRRRPACVAGGAGDLPFADSSFDLVVAAFSLNHMHHPEQGFREVKRVTRRGGTIVASAYAATDDHPVKRAVYAAVEAFGWHAPDWQHVLRFEVMPKLATVDRARAVAASAGLDTDVQQREVAFPELSADDLVDWRLGMAELAPFVAELSSSQQQQLRAEALRHLGTTVAVLVRTIIVITATV